MRNAALREIVSETAPSGPDLEDSGDQAYGEYVMLAGGRLPERFFSKEGDGSDRDVPFDRSRIDIDAESKAINELLQRTRDVRLLVLEARFQALAGSLRGFADSLQDLAELLAAFWDSIHPAPEEDDYTRRSNALEELESQVHVILPLTFAPLVGSGAGGISFRSYMLATEKARPRADELVPTLDTVMAALSSPRNTDQIARASQAVSDGLSALSAIRGIFIDKTGHGSAPGFDRQLKLLGEISALLVETRPDIAASNPSEQAGSPVAALGTPSAEPPPTVGAVKIVTQAEASAALVAIERYFQAQEPSSPALILVHQARMLFGKPLIAALEALLPDTSGSLALRFDGAGQFDIGLSQMRAITDNAAMAETALPPDDNDDLPGVVFGAETRGDAASLMLGVEGFYRQAEPSSPIPLLLSKARSLFNKDFAVILGELLPRSGQ